MRILYCLLALLLPASLALAEIYRCDIDGVVVFSETACQAQAQPYRPARGISVVAPAADLKLIEQRNQAFIQARLEQQSALLQARARAGAPASRPVPAQHPGPVFAVTHFAPDPDRAHTRRDQARRPDSRRQSVETSPPEPRFSALGGPFPGTRRPNEP